MGARLAFVGCDTPHVEDFARRLMHVDVAPEHWARQAQVVVAFPGESAIDPASIPKHTDALRKYGIAIADSLDDLLDPKWRLDAVFVEAQDGSVHHDLAMPFVRAGMPVFVDKPFACSVEHARDMVDTARKSGSWLLSSSSLRFVAELREIARSEVLGASTYSPALHHPRNPGFFHYGVHGVEMLYQLMGPGCAEVTCATTADADVIVGTWGDGRLGCVRGTRQGPHAYGFTAHCGKRVVAANVDAHWLYERMLDIVLDGLERRQTPIAFEEMVEVVAFQEAANRSVAEGGRSVRVEV